jgi:transcriptional regulator with XRE-family HTH domain
MAIEIDQRALAAEVGARLRAFRDERCLSQREMADNADISRQQFRRYERGEDVPQTIALIRLSTYMERSISWILFGEDAQEQAPADRDVRQCMFDLEGASPECRRTAIEMAYALMATDRNEAKLMARRTDEGPFNS